MKKYSISLVIRETQIKTTRYHLIPIRMTIIKNIDKCWCECVAEEPLYTVGGL